MNTDNSANIFHQIAQVDARAFHENQFQSQWQYFEYSVKILLARWTALRMAIEGKWGGGDMQRKSEILLEEILNVFKYSKNVQYVDMVINITEYVDVQFGLVCEDGSIEEIVELMLTIAEECKKGDYNRIRVLHEKMQALIPIDLKNSKFEQAITRKQEESLEDDKCLVDDEGWATIRRSSRIKRPVKMYDPAAEFPGAQ
ncbi:hypothetical protein ABG067_004539 [Albugo candida]